MVFLLIIHKIAEMLSIMKSITKFGDNMPCEMCGKEGNVLKADIEGAVLVVCNECAKFGKIISRVRAPIKNKKSESQPAKKQVQTVKRELLQLIVEDYAKVIKEAREKLGLKQQDLARKIAEKESLIQNIETEKFVPGMDLARKFERFLKIKLIEQHEESHQQKFKAKSAALTIGDMLSLKK